MARDGAEEIEIAIHRTLPPVLKAALSSSAISLPASPSDRSSRRAPSGARLFRFVAQARYGGGTDVPSHSARSSADRARHARSATAGPLQVVRSPQREIEVDIGAAAVGDAVEHARGVVDGAAPELSVNLHADVTVRRERGRKASLDEKKVGSALETLEAEWSLELAEAQR